MHRLLLKVRARNNQGRERLRRNLARYCRTPRLVHFLVQLSLTFHRDLKSSLLSEHLRQVPKFVKVPLI